MAGSMQQIAGLTLLSTNRRSGEAFGAARAQRPGDAKARRRGALAHAVENEVIPRLMLARVQAQDSPAASGTLIALSAEEIAAFAAIVLRPDTGDALSLITDIRARGASAQALCLGLLAPTARLLGDLWIDDACSFGDVTVALLRLHDLLRGLGPEFRGEGVPRPRARRALLATVPGAQHSFGLAMLAGCFRLAGWSVQSGQAQSNEHLAGLVRDASFDLVGLSASCEVHLSATATAIRTVRRASQNPLLGIMVGGPVFTMRPELAVLVGADTTASDGSTAPGIADALLAALQNNRDMEVNAPRVREVGRFPAAEEFVSRDRIRGLPEPGNNARRPRRGFGRSSDRDGG